MPEGDSAARKPAIERVSLFHPHRIQGDQVEYELMLDGRVFHSLPYKARCGRLADTNEAIILKTALTDEGMRLLDREKRIGEQLWADFRVPSYPGRFSRFIGYNTERGTYLLLQTRRGDPLEDLPAPGGLRLDGDRLESAVRGLLVGLAELSGIGLVHRAICPRTVLWDGTDVQITDFADTVMAGARVGWAAGSEPWSPPSAAWRLDRRLIADSRDDVYSVAALIFWLHTGEPVGDPADMRERLRRHGRLSSLLDGCFAERAVDRPTPTQLLQRSEIAESRLAGRRGIRHDEEMRAEHEYEDIRRRQLQKLRSYEADRPNGRAGIFRGAQQPFDQPLPQQTRRPDAPLPRAGRAVPVIGVVVSAVAVVAVVVVVVVVMFVAVP